MYRIGIDLGGTNIAAGVVDDQYRILGKANYKTRLPRRPEEIVADAARAAEDAAAATGLTMDRIACVGIGAPGTCNADTGLVEYANNLGFERVPVRDMLGGLLHKSVRVENDGNAAALGETLAGSAAGAESCVCVTLGTGIGGGIVLDGKIFDGVNYAGAELGHMVIVKGGKKCSCGRKGCWEAYASATALISQTRRAMNAHPESLLWKTARRPEEADGRTAFDAMRLGDFVAKQVVDAYIGSLACGLVNIVNLFQPEVLCIGGGICKEGGTLLGPLEETIRRERYSRYSARQTRLCVAALGNAAGIIGAAFLGEERPADGDSY